mmetsp:Transcript_55084/g.163991  ORF Transcript_55084/g.163991 Transcript_55084/m.163991 type:complete len:264 (+) Transcript_55084:438-1229(+)
MSLARARASHVQILSVRIWCIMFGRGGGAMCESTRVCKYRSATSSSSPLRTMKPTRSSGSWPSGTTPKLSFFATVMRTGTLFHLPCAMSFRGSPGIRLPSTTVCHPRSASASPRFAPFVSCVNLSRDTMFLTNAFFLPGRLSASEFQSKFQSFWGATFRRQRRSFSPLPLHLDLSIMNLVRSLFAVRDHMSAGGERSTHRWNRPSDRGDTRWDMMIPPPSLCPISVTLLGSPPKAPMCLCTQWSSSCWSMSPKLFVMPEPVSP